MIINAAVAKAPCTVINARGNTRKEPVSLPDSPMTMPVDNTPGSTPLLHLSCMKVVKAVLNMVMENQRNRARVQAIARLLIIPIRPVAIAMAANEANATAAVETPADIRVL